MSLILGGRESTDGTSAATSENVSIHLLLTTSEPVTTTASASSTTAVKPSTKFKGKFCFEKW